MTPDAPPPPAKESSLPLVGMIFSGLGLIVPPLLLVGLVIGIIAVVQKKGSRVLAILAVLIPLLAGGIFSLLFLMGMKQRKALSWQSECRANLKSAFTSQVSYFQEHDRFDEHPATVQFMPERGNRYAYVFAAEGPVPPHAQPLGPIDVGVGIDPARGSNAEVLAALPLQLRATLGLKGTCPACTITMLCVANLDDDPALDIWTITASEWKEGSAMVQPVHVSNDLNP